MKRTQNFEPLAIVGMSCLFPKAQSLQDYWANIKEKVDCIKEVPDTHWKGEDYYDADKKCPDHVYTKNGGFLDAVDFNPAEWGIAPSDLDSIDTSQLLSLVVAKGALVDAGYGNKDFDRDNTSVILGLTGCLELVIPLGARLGHPFWRKAMLHAGIDEKITNEVMDSIGKCYVGWQENSFPGLLGNCAAGRIANRLNLGGTNCVVDAACGSSLGALNMAAMELWTGKADMAITGGVDTFNDIFMFMCFCKTPALSKTGHARPFSADNDGTILGEGIGMVVLKRLSDAERDGDRIYACVNAVGTSSDGKGKAVYAPSVPGQVKALKRAYEQSGIDPHDITMIEAHGTGTGAGDKVEVDALKEVYGESSKNRPWCALGSVKSQIGHTKAAAGSANLIKAALALYNKVIPPTIKISQPAPSLVGENIPFYLPNETRPWVTENGKTRHAAISSMGFGGSNFHVILSEYKSEKSEYDWERNVELITISGSSAADVKSKLSSLTTTELRRFAAECRRNFNSEDKARLAFMLDSDTDLHKLSDDLNAMLDAGKDFNMPNGAIFCTKEKPGKIGVLFPGQGSQYPQMALKLVCASPSAFNFMAEADKEIGILDETGNHLTDYIYPIPTYSDADALSGVKLTATEIAQPSLGAVSIGMYETLKDFGFKADGFAGHSYGELVALCAAGLYDSKALAKISRKRGQLMSMGEGDHGGMIAVVAERSVVEDIMKEEKLDLVVANHNSNKQVVLSGETAEITRSQDIFKKKKIKAVVLKVSGAFHSKFVADAAKPFYEYLKEFKFNSMNSVVYSDTNSKPYPTEVEKARELLGNQLANQVLFVDIIKNMYADGIRTFVEVGPGATLSGMLKNILDTDDYNVVTIDSSKGKGSALTDFGKALAKLSALGYKLDLSKWQNGEEWLKNNPTDNKPKMLIKLCGSNYKSKALLDNRAEIEKAPVRKLIELKSGETVISNQQLEQIKQSAANASSQQLSQNTAPVQVQTSVAMPSATLETLAALQIMQQETAELHRRFLEGQELAQKALMAAIGAGSVTTIPMPTVSAPVMPVAAPLTPATPTPVAATPVVVPTATKEETAPAKPVAVTAPVEKPVSLASNNGLADKIKKTLIDVVSEKTGYPAEMLNLDMDMEADLGIDSIKRVEIMSAMQEACPEAPVVQPDQLSKLRTLNQILETLAPAMNATPVTNTATNKKESAVEAAVNSSDNAEDFELKRTVIKAVEIGETNGLKLLSEGDKVLVSNEDSDLSKALCDELKAKKLKAETMSLKDIADGKLPSDTKALVIVAAKPDKATLNLWEDSSDEWLKDAFMAVKAAGTTLKANKGVLATVSRLDGKFGLGSLTNKVDPIHGGLAGITKTTRYEWPEITSKAIDLDYRLKDDEAAAKLIANEISVNGPMETGLSKSGRIMIEEVAEPLSENTSTAPAFQKGDTIIVTGGARGVTAETAIAFAEKYGTNMLLIGRSPLPEQEPAWLANLTEEKAIKQAIMQNNGKPMTPKELGAAYKTAMANREVLINIARLQKLGVKVKYCSASVLDEEQVASVIDTARNEMGPIAGVIHGAGVKRDKNIEDKTREQLDDVINTKVRGLKNVLKATIKDNLKCIVLFSSFSGRQGRTGQIDYAMANECLNKCAQKLRVLRQDCRVMAFNWGPWDGGMVDASLRKVFINEGIGLIPLKKGARCPIVELTNTEETNVEIGIIGLIDGKEALSSSKKA